MHDFPIDVQLDVDASAGDPADVAYRWLTVLSTHLAGDELKELAALPARVVKTGEPGGLFGVVSVLRMSSTQPPKTAERNASGAGLKWLRNELIDVPWRTAVVLGRWDERGFRSGDVFNAEVGRVDSSPGWLRLCAHLPASRFLAAGTGQARQRQWLDALRPLADEFNPGFGHISYFYPEHATALEDALLPSDHPVDQREPEYSIGQCRQWLRGYSWLTIIPQSLADKLGGVPALRTSGAFEDVIQLRNGGVWLLATDTFEGFDSKAAVRIFQTLEPVIRRGTPRPTNSPFPTPPRYLAYPDPR